MIRTIAEPDLLEALEQIFGMPVLHLSHRPFDYSSSFAIEELEITTPDRKHRLLLKDVGPDAVLSAAARAKPGFLYHPLREIHLYGRILSLLDLGTPKLYGGVVNETIGRYWLFLERVDAPRLWESGELEVWVEAARWLARLHSSAASEPALARSLVPQLVKQSRFLWEMWLQRAHSRLGSSLGNIGSVHEHALQYLETLPRSLIHGEFYPSNILVQHRGGDLRICPVDWEMAAVGPGILDVAALASGSWTRAERLTIAQAWYDALPERLRPPDLETALDCAQLQIALQWLGWSADWVPPNEHAYDWFAEALRMASAERIAKLAGVRRACIISG